jgi:uncharacterized protein involved in propanediol utilization
MTMTEGAVGTGRAFGTFGELLQGVLPEHDRDFLVTFPLDAWATATFRHTPDRPDIVVGPGTKIKSHRLVRLALNELGEGGGGLLTLTSELPEGKGLASSSADLVAAARAVAAAFGRTFDEPTIESLLRRIEPSDGVMYDEIVAFYHREVRLHDVLGTLPPLAIIGHDEGGQVDTIRHNRLPKPFTARDKREYARLLVELAGAVEGGDLHTVGRIATRSAELNAKLRPRHGFQELRRACAEVDGFGLVLAHSGTMLGILLGGDDPEQAAKTEHVKRNFAALGGEFIEHRSLSGARMGV